MKIELKKINKLRITEANRLDPVDAILEDFAPGQGKVTITCYGEAWTAYWGAMGECNVAEFFCSCDEHYLANKLSDIDPQIYDIDAIREQAAVKGVDCWHDDPWNDHEFLSEMYGSDMVEWGDSLPKTVNPEYKYLCRIIKAAKEAIRISNCTENP